MKTTLLILAFFGALTACETSKTTYRIAGQKTDLTKSSAEAAHSRSLVVLPAGDNKNVVFPHVISAKFPDYTQRLINANIAGAVRVQFFIEEDGSVSNPRIHDSPPPELAAIVSRAVMQWKFSPAKRDGVLIRMQARQQFDFSSQ